MSSEKRSKQPVVRWTADEDANLIRLVEEHGKQWMLIASKLEGGKRNDLQCRNRWRANDPSLATGKFTAAEDASLTKLVAEHGASAWTLIASKLEGGRRSDRQCSNRWLVIDPSITTGKFSSVEDASWTKLVAEHGKQWMLIASKLEGGKRNDEQCRKRWKVIDPSLATGKFTAAEDASLKKLVAEHGASAWALISSKLEGGRRSDRQCRRRWITLGKSNGKGSSNSSSSSSSSKQSASPKPPSTLEADSDNDDSSVDDDASFEHVLMSTF
jgi:hypothetical protein